MKKLSLLTLIFMLLFTSCEKTLVDANNFEVSFITDSTFKMQISLDSPGTLNSFITPFHKKHLEAIKIDGKINGDDFQSIRDIWEFQEAVFGKSFLADIDLSDCELLAGGCFVYLKKTYENVEGELVTHVDSIFVQPSKDNAIPPYAFAGLWLKTITIPSTINSIGDYAFKGCEIRSFCMPNSVVEIGKGTFSHAYIQSPIDMPEGIVSLPDSAFYYATQIPSITLPSSLQSVEQYCFSNCWHLQEIVAKSIVPPLCDATMWDNEYIGKRTLYVPAESLNAYRSHPIWGKANSIKPIITK